jgi:hypothetical protein
MEASHPLPLKKLSAGTNLLVNVNRRMVGGHDPSRRAWRRGDSGNHELEWIS